MPSGHPARFRGSHRASPEPREVRRWSGHPRPAPNRGSGRTSLHPARDWAITPARTSGRLPGRPAPARQVEPLISVIASGCSRRLRVERVAVVVTSRWAAGPRRCPGGSGSVLLGDHRVTPAPSSTNRTTDTRKESRRTAAGPPSTGTSRSSIGLAGEGNRVRQRRAIMGP
jgi:hypothetical protein